MDHDDNDFQSQNIHLGGEGSTKHPPASQPYTLPRFDFDDGLQGHLRFDSLVDSEVFLGIGSNEDNQWIEDFSRGNSAIAFNSTGADTSSISIRKNVWSEATSSESVEMLLNSIGQEEVNPLQNTCNESVSCYEPSPLTEQMETSPKTVSGSLSEAGDATDLHARFTSHEIPDNSHGLMKDVRVDDIQVHHTSQTCETSVIGHSGASNIEAVHDKERGSAVTEDDHPTREQFTEKDEAETYTLKDKLVDDFTRDLRSSVAQVTDKERGSSIQEANLPIAEQFIKNEEAEIDAAEDKLVNSCGGDLSASDVQFTSKERSSFVIAGNVSSDEQFNENNEAKTDLVKDKLLDSGAGDLSASDVDFTDKERVSTAAEGNLPTAEQFTKKDEVEIDAVKDKLMDSGAGDLSATDIQVNNNIKCSIELGSQDNLPPIEQVTEKDEVKTDRVKDMLADNYMGDLSAADVQVKNNIKCNIESGSQDDSRQSDNKSEEYAEGIEARCSKGVVPHHDPSDRDFPADDQNLDEHRVANVVSNLDNPCSDYLVESVSEVKESVMSCVEPCVTTKDEPLSTSPILAKDCESVTLSVDMQTNAKSEVDLYTRSTSEAHPNPNRHMEEDSKSRSASPAFTMDSAAQMRCVQDDYLLNRSKKSNTESVVDELGTCLVAAGESLHVRSGEVGGSNKLHEGGISDSMVVDSSAEPLIGPPAIEVMTYVSEVCSENKEPMASTVSPIKQKLDQSMLNRQVDDVECGDNGPMKATTVEEGTELSDGVSKSDNKDSGIEGNAEKDKMELKPQCKAHNEPDFVSLPEGVHSGNISGQGLQGGDTQPLLPLNLEANEIDQVVMATDTIGDNNPKMDVSPGMNDSEVEEGNVAAEVPSSSGRLDDGMGQFNNEKVSQVAGDVVEDLEGPPRPAALSELGAQLKSSDDVFCHAENNKAACDKPPVLKSIDLPPAVDKTKECKVGGDKSAELSKENDKSDDGICQAENNKAACDSPTVFKSIDLPQSVDKTEECRVDEGNSAEVAKEKDKDCSKGLSSPQYLSRNDAPKCGEGFTFKLSSIANVAGTEAGNSIQAASTMSASMTTKMVGETPSSPSLRQSHIKSSHDISPESPDITWGEVIFYDSNVTSGRKSRRTPGKALSKDNSKKGKASKEATPIRQSEKGKKSVNTSSSPPGICSPLQSSGLHLFGNVECSSGKKFGVLASPTPSVPDLNTSAPASALYQPFTDLQQVQLRAQIFVYGALIQGMVPAEAYMTSAFGGPDGGRNAWENAWRTSMERLQNQNPHTMNPETPLQINRGSMVSDQPSNPSVSRNKSVGQAVGRYAQSSLMSPMNSFSSPLWAYQTPSSDALQPSGFPRGPVFDFNQSVAPLHSYQTPPISNIVGHNTSWMPQASLSGPWVASPQLSSTRFPTYPPTEVVQLTPVRESSLRQSAGAKNDSGAPGIQSGSPGNMLTSTSTTVDISNMVASTVQKAGSKSRKRRKAPISENPDQTSAQPQSNAEMVSIPVGISHPSASPVTVTPSGLNLKVSKESTMVQMCPVEHMKKLHNSGELSADLSEDTLSKIKEARVQAENAASTAAAATNHCHELWSGLAKHSTSRLVPDVENRLSSAAAAIAAAACVAKAAAAAANVASNAALQAKLMAEEALVSRGYISGLSDDVNNSNATPSSILDGGNEASTSNSVIVVAKEAARRRVEAATAASKQAENMDAIVKAAELAAEAVSHAGKIVAMGNPLVLNELVKSGPEGYWKSHLPPELARNSNLSSARKATDTSEMRGKRGTSVNFNAKASTSLKSSGSKETVGYCNEDGMSGSAAISKNERLEGGKVSDVARTTVAVPESETTTNTYVTVHNDHDREVQTSTPGIITKGCLIEVLRDGDGFAAWYQANVLDLLDGKAFVCYTELKSDEGSENLKEWVSLNSVNEAPKIRIARPMAATQFEGRRKRRRTAVGDYNWSVGDRVDAWVQNRWCEGIVTERSKKDSTTFTVQFPGLEKSSDVKAWHLRPSLIWEDGNWIEVSQSRGTRSFPHESDSPLEKRRKMGTPAVEKGKDKLQQNDGSLESNKPEDIKLLDLAANEKAFNMGKSNKVEKKHETLKSLRTNLQKGGSRVIFGVPKPGKKRKFMEVSKHYVSDQGTKSSEANKSTKIAKYMMPQGSGSRGSKFTAKGGLKEKGPVTKPNIPKSGKSSGASSRNIVQKDKDVDTSVSAAAGDETVAEHNDSMKEYTSRVTTGKQGTEHSSFSRSDGSAVDGSFVFSSAAASSDIPSRRTYLSNRMGRANKGELAPAGAKLAKVEEKISNRNETNSSLEAMEPRRSTRRIQPTSRLLEGLQSSFVSKIPSVSHDRSLKNQNRTAPRGSTRR